MIKTPNVRCEVLCWEFFSRLFIKTARSTYEGKDMDSEKIFVTK